MPFRAHVLKAEKSVHFRVLADRLDAWLAEGHAFPERGRQQELAAELGVTREALYREMARRRKKPATKAGASRTAPDHPERNANSCRVEVDPIRRAGFAAWISRYRVWFFKAASWSWGPA